MKTQKQISQWIGSREWLPSFKRNIELQEDDTTFLDDILSGKKMQYTIAVAFDWSRTSEGDLYWGAINEEFQQFCK